MYPRKGASPLPPEHSLEKLASALTHPEWDVRSDALKELEYHDPEQAVPLLLKALSDEHSSIRQSAVSILARLQDRRVVEPLIALLEDEDFLVRWHILEALGTLGDSRAIDPLIGALVDPNGNPQMLAVAVLTSFPASEVMQAFTRACARPTQWLARRAAVFARGPWVVAKHPVFPAPSAIPEGNRSPSSDAGRVARRP